MNTSPSTVAPAVKPFGWFSELIDTSTGEIMQTDFNRVGPRTGNHGIDGCEWKSIEVGPVKRQPAITDEALAKRLLHAKMGVSESIWSSLTEHERASWIEAAQAARKILTA